MNMQILSIIIIMAWPKGMVNNTTRNDTIDLIQLFFIDSQCFVRYYSILKTIFNICRCKDNTLVYILQYLKIVIKVKGKQAIT